MVKTMLNIYVVILGVLMIFGKGTGKVQTTDVNDYVKSINVKSRTYSKEDYLWSQKLSNGDFVVVTEQYEDDYRIIQKEGTVGLKAEFDSDKDIHVYVNGTELTEDKVRQMSSSDIRIYSDLIRDWQDGVIRH